MVTEGLDSGTSCFLTGRGQSSLERLSSRERFSYPYQSEEGGDKKEVTHHQVVTLVYE